MFRSRNFNIDSISVGVTDDPNLSRMTITTYSDEKQTKQIVKQLDKMIDVLEVEQLDEQRTFYRELAIFKIHISDANASMEINKLAMTYGGKVHNVRSKSVIVELTATPHQINSFEDIVRPFGIINSARTGVAAVERSTS